MRYATRNLSHIQYKFELFAEKDKRPFCQFIHYDNATIPLHLELDAADKTLIVNHLIGGVWGTERRLPVSLSADSNSVLITIVFYSTKAVITYGQNQKSEFRLAEGIFCSDICWIEMDACAELSGMLREPDYAKLWRKDGFKSGLQSLPSLYTRDWGILNQGLSAVIRAKNEEHNIENCISTISPLVDEIIFVDNDSSDKTYNIAKRLQGQYFNLKCYSYPITIPRAGEDHAKAVSEQSSNTLGHYYNWALEKSRRFNFMKWDADYIAVPHNFSEMAHDFNIRARGDNFTVWFSGLELYTDGERYWVDPNSKHSEFRVFSKKHDAHWVNLPPWEEMEQTYLYKASKYFYDKPVYTELFRLDEVEFKDRGIFTNDERDRERLEFIRNYKSKGKVPRDFIEVEGPFDEKLKSIPLSKHELSMAKGFANRYQMYPRIRDRASKDIAVEFDTRKDSSIFVIITCCEARLWRTEAQRRTWIKDLLDAGIPYAFIVGRPNQPSQLVDDILYVDAPDNYESLSFKIGMAISYVYNNLNVNHVFKIDDDVVLNVDQLLLANYEDFDYIGGRIATSDVAPADWHFNKCENYQLNSYPHHVERGISWYGGQFGYCLSRKAMKVINDNILDLKKELYEDVGVAKVLKKAGMKANAICYNLFGVSHAEWLSQNKRPDVATISDIPDNERVEEAYHALRSSDVWDQASHAYRRTYRVDSDWMDIQDIFQQLASKEEEAELEDDEEEMDAAE